MKKMPNTFISVGSHTEGNVSIRPRFFMMMKSGTTVNCAGTMSPPRSTMNMRSLPANLSREKA